MKLANSSVANKIFIPVESCLRGCPEELRKLQRTWLIRAVASAALIAIGFIGIIIGFILSTHLYFNPLLVASDYSPGAVCLYIGFLLATFAIGNGIEAVGVPVYQRSIENLRLLKEPCLYSF